MESSKKSYFWVRIQQIQKCMIHSNSIHQATTDYTTATVFYCRFWGAKNTELLAFTYGTFKTLNDNKIDIYRVAKIK